MKRTTNPGMLLLVLLLAGCSIHYHQFASDHHFTNTSGIPDYSNLDYWAAHPYKKDPSDSVPSSLRRKYDPDTTVDVFFIHPTTYTEQEKRNGWNAAIDNAELNNKTDYTTILYQASIFNEAGRVFSPRYRQAHLSAYYPKNADDSSHSLAALEVAYEDVKAAFTYYLAHYNKGRPIIIASHSQGTTHARRLLKEFFDDKPLQRRLVAAYLIGMPLQPGYYSSLHPCSTPAQTGCVCSWRTYRDGYKPLYVKRELYTAIVTNPLTWDSARANASRYQNKGSVLFHFNTMVKHAADAHVDNGVLWIHKPHFFGSLFYNTRNYHVADMNLYYLSIRKNAAERVGAYRKK